MLAIVVSATKICFEKNACQIWQILAYFENNSVRLAGVIVFPPK